LAYSPTRARPTRPTTGPVAAPTQAELMALLLRTLWGYRALGCDPTRAAAALGVHCSTLRFRLYRIRELTGLAPEDPRSVQALRAITGPHP
jgi:sugar diacid utilization regulator